VVALVGSGAGSLGGSAGAAFSGVNGKFVFFKDDFPNSVQIYSMNGPGNGEKNLSAKGGGGSQLDLQPSVSPDGQSIAFVRLDQATGSGQLWTMTFEGLKQSDVSNDAASFSESGPAWSADGSKLLFVRQPPGSFPGDQGGGPATAGGTIWMRNADGSGTPIQVTNGAHDANPVMSSDGTRIAFSRPVSGARHIFVMNTNGSGLTDLGVGSKPDWSPDGTHLVYGQGGSGPIMVVNVSNPADTQTLTGFGDEAPVWSPDGTEIAFLDCTSGVCQIAVMNADGTQARDLTNDTASDQKVDWQAHAH
jgi:Tol biopolymer transport system component